MHGDEEAHRAYIQEKCILTQLDREDHIVQLAEFIETVSDDDAEGNKSYTAFFLFELCPSGSLLELIQSRAVS